MSDPAQSPCVRHCCLDDDLICVGCFRSLEEIKAWAVVDNERRRVILQESKRRQETYRRKAQLFMNNRSQAVRLPKEFQFNATEVFIRRQGDEVILSPRPEDWTAYLTSGPVASKEFMEAVDDLRVQEREL